MNRALAIGFVAVACCLSLVPEPPPDSDPTFPLSLDEEPSDAMRSALIKWIDVDFKRTPLEQAAAMLGRQAGVAITLDPTSLANAMVDRNQPVDLRADRVRLATALDLMLSPLNLVAQFRPDVVVVVDRESTKKTNTQRFYPVADLVLNATGGWVDSDGRKLSQILVDSVDRDVWEPNGGDATITFYLPALCLVITAPPDTQYKVRQLLGMLRRAKGQTAELLERNDLGKLEDVLANLDRVRISPLGLYQPPEYPPASKVNAVVESLPQTASVANEALNLAKRLEEELKQLKKPLPQPTP